MENRNGLLVDAALTHATGTAEREAALAMLARRKTRRRVTLGADKAYDVSGFVSELRARYVTPHIAIDGHTTRHVGYAVSQRLRKRIEEGSDGSRPSAASPRWQLPSQQQRTARHRKLIPPTPPTRPPDAGRLLQHPASVASL